MPADMPSSGDNNNGRTLEVEALIDYIATTPQNINYNIVREIIKAIISHDIHPYFDYYQEKIGSEESGEPGPAYEDAPGMEEEGPGGGKK